MKIFNTKDKLILQLSSTIVLLILIPLLVATLIRNNIFNDSYARPKSPICQSLAGICVTENRCRSKGGLNYDIQDCTANKICCINVSGQQPPPNDPTSWDVDYDGNILPGNSTPFWVKLSSGDPEVSVSDGVLTINNGSSDWIYYQKTDSNLANDEVTIEAKIKVVSSDNTAECFIGVDHAIGEPYWELELFENRIELHEDIGLPVDTFYMDTTNDFHTYRLTRNGTNAKVYVDGMLRLKANLKNTAATTSTIYFGSYMEGVSHHNWDYFRYVTDGSYDIK